MKVGVAEQQAFVQAALAVPAARSAKLDAAWRDIACRDVRDWRRWPDLFERYWHPQRQTGCVRVSGRTRPSRDLRQLVQTLHDELGDSATRTAPRRRAACHGHRAGGSARSRRVAGRWCTAAG